LIHKQTIKCNYRVEYFKIYANLQNVKAGYEKREEREVAQQLSKHCNTIFKLKYFNMAKERTVYVIFQGDPNPNFT
jgi:hypothetical protein